MGHGLLAVLAVALWRGGRCREVRIRERNCTDCPVEQDNVSALERWLLKDFVEKWPLHCAQKF